MDHISVSEVIIFKLLVESKTFTHKKNPL